MSESSRRSLPELENAVSLILLDSFSLISLTKHNTQQLNLPFVSIAGYILPWLGHQRKPSRNSQTNNSKNPPQSSLESCTSGRQAQTYYERVVQIHTSCPASNCAARFNPHEGVYTKDIQKRAARAGHNNDWDSTLQSCTNVISACHAQQL